MSADVEELLTVDELAAYLKVPKNWVYQAVSRSGMPVVKVGNHSRFLRSEVMTWLRDKERAESG